MEITYQYMKKRSEFGRQPVFSEASPELCDSIAPDPAEQPLYMLRNPVHRDAQNAPSFGKRRVNTPRPELVAAGVNHAEGGWPRDVHTHDPEALQRHRRKGEREDAYVRCVMTLAPEMDRCLLQNNTVDLYESYFMAMPRMRSVAQSNCRNVNVYRDLERGGGGGGSGAGGRPVSSVHWQPGGGQRLAVTYADVAADRSTAAPLAAYLWNIHDANTPEARLEPPCPLLELQYDPRHEHVLAGALLSGQVGAWDARAGAAPVALCPPHVAHRDLARNVLFIASKSGKEFFSSSPDGVCKWWDMRSMDEPTDEMIMDIVQNSSDSQSFVRAHGVCALEYESTLPTRFMVGTEDGLVISGNRKGKTPLEKLPAKYAAHAGPVHAVARNPGSLKNFLTVGDWTARVWSEDCRDSAALWTPPSRHRLTHAAWSPTRHSLMLVTRRDGWLLVWDLLQRQHEPALPTHVCDEPLLRVAVHETGQFVACGSQKGNIYLEELSPDLLYCDKNDKAMLHAVFEREGRRERILEARLRELRLRLRQTEEEGSRGSASASASDELDERDLDTTTAEYFAALNKDMVAKHAH